MKKKSKTVEEVIKTITLKEAVEFIYNNNGKIFSVVFISRVDKSEREMTCRTGVKSKLVNTDAPPKDWKANALIGVFDMNALDRSGQKGAYRSIPMEGIIRIKMDGEWFTIKEN